VKTAKIDDVEYVEKIEYDKLKEKTEKEVREQMKEETSKAYLIEPCNVMLMGRIINIDDEKDKLLKIKTFEFLRDNSDVRILMDLKNKDRIEVYKGKERWVYASKEFFDMACKVAKAWKGIAGKENDIIPEVYVNENKDYPILIGFNEMGFVLAPRIEAEE
jgi:hypothetical protein